MPSLRWVFHIFVVISIVQLQSLSCNSSSFSFNQQQLDKVWKLPGQNFNAVDDPSSKPLALWLNGGRYDVVKKRMRIYLIFSYDFSVHFHLLDVVVRHGYSSIALGLAEEIGPLHIEKYGKTLYFNPYSWNKVANILFVDSPVGVGFSYSNTPSDIVSNGDKRTADDILIFMENWLERFPQYKGREFYLIGESYAGHYIPQLTHAIVKHNEKHGVETINLKGFLTYKQLYVKCAYESFVHNSEECEKVLTIADQELEDIDEFSIYTPPCPTTSSRLSHLRRSKTDSSLSVLDVYAELLNSGLRIWMFSFGQLGRDALGRRMDRRIRYEGLTFVVVRGAGHEVPLHKPKQALTLFKSFLSGKSMPEMELVSDM
ncbi:hypothetical protein SASPL_125771 [Salvia splendens]|uniref:Carboxypeptidase n=1 Tax=Salvia splendens TaxID=180675 RepID=A0A8X8ZPF6_SALSN|nr:hypothetical protein SASPL_125771 [Salvia splendens]